MVGRRCLALKPARCPSELINPSELFANPVSISEASPDRSCVTPVNMTLRRPSVFGGAIAGSIWTLSYRLSIPYLTIFDIYIIVIQ
jgi:hypothetical protein